jgi:hypothetical protein
MDGLDLEQQARRLASGYGCRSRAEIAFPFNLLAGICKAAAPGDLAFFVVAMLLFPRAACDNMTAECLAFIHRSGKGGSGGFGRRRSKTSQFL